jgi:multiple sugar transport system permease protein
MRSPSSLWRHAAALLLVAVLLAPVVLMVAGSLRDPDLAPPRGPELIPSPLVPGNYRRAFELVDLARYALNSALVAGVAVPLAVIVGSWAALAMTRLPRRLALALVVVSLVALMVPLTALLVPRFAIFRALGLTGTYVPLVAPALIGLSPFYVLIFYRAFRRIPAELFDAARLEGLGPLAIWRRVAMPQARPATVAVAMLGFAAMWSNVLDPLVYLFDERTFTLPLGLRALAALPSQDFPIVLAGAAAATAPVVIVFLLAQRLMFREARA